MLRLEPIEVIMRTFILLFEELLIVVRVLDLWSRVRR